MIRILQKLNADIHEGVGSLFKGLDHTLIVRVVIEGSCPGTVYVDDSDAPNAALLISSQGYYLAGDAQCKEFNEGLKEFFDRGWDGGMSLNYHPSEWEDVIEKTLSGKYPVKVHGYTYEFQGSKVPESKLTIPSGRRMIRIDGELLSRDNLRNHGAVIEYIDHTWMSRKDFLTKDFGFCLMHEDMIVSWCLSDCVSGTRCEIGIETDEEYQRRGYATLTTSAAVAHCLEKGFTRIGWHTGPTNVASMRTAERAGFRKVLEDTYYFSWFFPMTIS